MGEDKCQSIYWNLLNINNTKTIPVFLRELNYTSECDQYYDFSRIRESYKKMIGNDSIERIHAFEETTKDERRAEQAFFHYSEWTKYNLKCSLNLSNLLWYHSIHRLERMLDKKLI